MENLNLDSDETVIHTTQRLIITGVGYEAAFTGSRLILVDRDFGKPQITIPYTEIELAAAATNKLREPVIRITYNTPDGSTRGIELIFIFLAAGRNVQNRDKCVAILEKQGVPVSYDTTHEDFFSLSKRERMDAGTLEADTDGGRPAAPEWTVFGPTQSNKNTLQDEPKPTSPVFTIIVVALIAALLIGAMIAPIPEPGTKQPWQKTGSAGNAASTTPSPTLAPAPEITPEAVQTVATPSPEVTPAPGAVPGNGIWIKISYPGNYAGFLAAGGMRTDVNSSGTQLYQMPVHDTIIDIFVEKGDGSGDTLEIGVYNGGALVRSDQTSSPRGVLEMHVPVGPAIVTTPAVPEVTPVPRVATPIPTPASQYALPTKGVWVHVLYPGAYSGSLNFNGQLKEVNSSGEQYFQIPITGGVIDSSIKKADGSVNTLTIEVYKDGKMLDLANTTAPQGTVEIHSSV